MTTLTQADDLRTDDQAAITFAADQTWHILAGVLVTTERQSAVFSGADRDSLVNDGTIHSGADFEPAVFFNGNDGHVSNSAGARIIGIDDGVFTNCNTVTVDNAGDIQSLGTSGVTFEGSDGHLSNTGSISGRQSGVRQDGEGGVISNAGLITSDNVGIAIGTLAGVTTTIANGAGGIIRGLADAIHADSGGIAFTNLGTVIGDVDLAGAGESDVIVNRGSIVGAVLLGDGNDVFNGGGGTSSFVSGGNGNDQLTGGGRGDHLFGDSGNDRLAGAAGNDVLEGGSGFDTLIGGAGRDHFAFQHSFNLAGSVDRIVDFTANVDRIDLALANLGPLGVLAAIRFHIGGAAADLSDRIIYNPNNGFLSYDSDGVGGANQVHIATLAPHLALHNTDFLVEPLIA